MNISGARILNCNSFVTYMPTVEATNSTFMYVCIDTYVSIYMKKFLFLHITIMVLSFVSSAPFPHAHSPDTFVTYGTHPLENVFG